MHLCAYDVNDGCLTKSGGTTLEFLVGIKPVTSVMFKKRTLNDIDTVLKLISKNFYTYIFIQYSFTVYPIIFLFLFIRILFIAKFKELNVISTDVNIQTFF